MDQIQPLSEQNTVPFFIPTVIKGLKERLADASGTLQKELQLTSSVRALNYLADIFHTEGRDPTDEEMQLWDAWMSLRAAMPAYGWINELETVSDELVEVWNDVQTKSAVLGHDARLFPQSILYTGTADLIRTGKVSSDTGLHAAFDDVTAITTKCNGDALVHVGKGTSLTVSTEKAPSLQPGTNYDVIVCSDNNTGIVSVAQTVAQHNGILRPVEKDGILGILIRESRTFSLNFDKAILRPEHRLADLLLGQTYKWLCFVPSAESAAFVAAVDGTARIGSLSGGNRCHLRFGNRNYSLRADTLRKFCTTYKRSYTAFINEQDVPLRFPALVTANDAVASCILPLPSGTACNVLERDAAAADYRAGIKDAVTSAFAATISGITRETMQLGISLPLWEKDSPTAGACLSYLLGLYRAGQELLLPFSAVDFTDNENDVPQTALYAFGKTDLVPVADCLPIRSNVFTVNLDALQEKNVPWDYLRYVLYALREEIRCGRVYSAVPYAGISPLTVLSAAKVSFTSVADTANCDFLKYGYVLQCADDFNDHGCFTKIGTVEQTESSMPDCSRAVIQSDVYVDKPIVVLASFPGSNDSSYEIRVLRNCGADVQLFTVRLDNQNLINALSCAVLQANIVIVHGNMPETTDLPHRFVYAMHHLKERGGLTIFTENAVPAAALFGLDVSQNQLFRATTPVRLTVLKSDTGLFANAGYTVLKQKGSVMYKTDAMSTSEVSVTRCSECGADTFAEVFSDREGRTWAFCSGMTTADLETAVKYFK